MFSVVRLSARNQITIPQDVRDAIQSEPGDRIVFRTDENGRVYVDSLKDVNPQSVRGFLKRTPIVTDTESDRMDGGNVEAE